MVGLFILTPLAPSKPASAGEKSAIGVLLKELNQQAMSFAGIGNELPPVVEAFTVDANDLLSRRKVELDAVGVVISH
jgi:hypothetical protein